MSEEEKEETHKAARILSYIALIAGIAMFLCMLLPVPSVGLWVFNREAFLSERFDWLTNIAWYSGHLFKYLVIPANILFIVTLLIERNKRLQFLPLALVLIGILPNAMFFAACFS